MRYTYVLNATLEHAQVSEKKNQVSECNACGSDELP